MSFAAKKEFRRRIYYFHKAENIIPCNARKSMISNAEGLPGKAIDPAFRINVPIHNIFRTPDQIA